MIELTPISGKSARIGIFTKFIHEKQEYALLTNEFREDTNDLVNQPSQVFLRGRCLTFVETESTTTYSVVLPEM